MPISTLFSPPLGSCLGTITRGAVLALALLLATPGSAPAQPGFPRTLPPATAAPPVIATGFSATAPCCDIHSWQQVADHGATGRALAAMAYDGVRDEVLLFGGINTSFTETGETWSWNGVSWQQLPAGGPPPRMNAAMVYDSARQRVVLFGGQGSTVLGDTWEWDGHAWQPAALTGPSPSPRFSHMMAYDSDRKVTVLFGGSSGSNQVWEWDGTTWAARPVPPSSPVTRAGGAMAYDPVRKRVVLFGGGSGPTILGDTWEWDGREWTGPFAGPAPSPRGNFGMVYDAGCGRLVLFGGLDFGFDTLGDVWARSGTTWSPLPAKGPTARTWHSMVYVPTWDRTVLYGGIENLIISEPIEDTWTWGCPCEEEAAPLDADGNVIFPAELDPTAPIIYTDIDRTRGLVEDVYRGFDTSTDAWIDDYPCDFGVGGTIPDEALNPDVRGDLAAIGVDADPQEIVDTLTTYNNQIGTQEVYKKDNLKTAAALSPGYTPPVHPYCPDPAFDYYFGGRDIVFVHGLDTDALADRLAGVPESMTTWPADREEFYQNLPGFPGLYGWWKLNADLYWRAHIRHFFRDRNRRNRYLVVAWPATQRLEDGIRCVLEQIDLAMRTGQGVVNPVNPTCTQKFGTPSFVIVSHSTGALLSDAMLAAAANNPNLNAQHIARFCKAHIPIHGTVSGAQYATPVVALASLFSSTTPPSWLCDLATQALSGYSGLPASSFSCGDFGILLDSVLVDLVPAVAQWKWGLRYVSRSPVRSASINGGHPTSMSPLKYVLASGYDDGVITANSQAIGGFRPFPFPAFPALYAIVIPNWWLYWPSGFIPREGLLSWFPVYHMGVEKERAIGLFLDQRFWHLFPRQRVAGGPSPNKSPLGKIQKVSFLTGLLPPWMNCFNRYPFHYAYLFSPSDHFASEGISSRGYVGNRYEPSSGVENWEETVCMTYKDVGIYIPYAMPFGDNEPVLHISRHPPQVDHVRGRKITFKIRLFGRTYTKTWWLWRRHFFILQDSETKVECDYAYERLLAGGSACTGCDTCPVCVPDLNGDCVVDDFDLLLFEDLFAAGDVRADINKDGVVDELDRDLFMDLWRAGC